MMPGYDGVDLCRMIRQKKESEGFYVILITARTKKEDLVTGLDAGADDYIVKPFNKAELHARIRVGERIIRLESERTRRINELEDAISHIKTLQGLLPICMHCHKIMDSEENWRKVDVYLQENTNAELSHSICPECLEKHYPE
jgi:CheY-like chemotaxis protein